MTFIMKQNKTEILEMIKTFQGGVMSIHGATNLLSNP